MTLSAGTRLARYEIRSKIGAGGMAKSGLRYETRSQGRAKDSAARRARKIDAPFEVLVRAEEECQGLVSYTRLPGFDSLRADPRFGRSLLRMGLPPVQSTGALP